MCGSSFNERLRAIERGKGLNEKQLRWLEEVEETSSPVGDVVEYVKLTAEQAVELERIEAVVWAEFWAQEGRGE